jgi:hypothetical protein
LNVAADGYNLRLANISNAQGYNIGRNVNDGYLYFYGDQTSYDGYIFSGVGGEKMRITSAGNVGIGTTSPAQKLDIAGNAQVQGVLYVTKSGENSRFNSADANGPYVSFRNNGTAKGFIGSGFHLWTSPNNLADNFGIRAENQLDFGIGASVKMTLDSSGNVGIGTAAPNRTLTVHSASSSVMADFKYTAGGFSSIILSNTNGAAHLASVGNDFLISPGGTERVRVTNTGNVLIGTTTDSGDKLNVAGNISIGTSYKIYTGSASNSAGLDFGGSYFKASGYNGVIFYSSTAGVGSQTERMRITNGGNVGIGTTTPTAKLHVNGDIKATLASTTTANVVYYNSSTGLLTYGAVPSGTVTSITAGTGLSGGTITTSGTIALANTTVTAGSYTLASITVDAQGRITAASSGSAGGTGTVTSVAMTVPTGLSISGSPITTSGTLAVTFASGYSIPTTTKQTQWDTAYTNRIATFTTTGSSGAATFTGNTLNIPNYTLAGLGYTTPTLAQVTTAGNTTSNAITVNKLTINNGTYNASIGFGLINSPTANYFDVFFANNTGLRFGSPSFDGSAFQAFGGLHASYPGQLYFDYGSQQRTVANRSANFRNASSPSPVTVMKLTNTSNVLIGTTTDSGYKLDVNGTIRSNNVITASGGNSTDWNTAFGWGDHAAAGYITGTTGFTGVFTIPTNPPGQQNLDIQNGLIINVF